ncbi:MAG: hypothetical protein WAZ48_05335 [Lysobacteraceae bacterium]
MRRTPPRLIAVALFVGTLFISTFPTFTAVAAEPAPHAQLIAHLRASALHVGLADGRLNGLGADWLARESEDAQFVLIGEDHGMADVPQFATALWNASTQRPFDRLVIETGPHATAALEVARDNDGIAALNARHPTAIPFFNWREDGDMAANAMRDANGQQTLCGIDQEFILSGRLLFRSLAKLAPDAAARDLADGYAARDDALYREMMAKRNPEIALMTQLQASDFESMRSVFGSRPEALTLIDDIALSAEIYRLQANEGYRSNTMRSTLMKRNFMRCYRDEQRNTPQPRALFRMGAMHVARGRSAVGVMDIGNLASELAASNDATSLHVLVIAAGGDSNRWYPFADNLAAKRTPYNAKEELEIVGALPLLEAADTDRWILIPLAPLREQSALRRAGGNRFEQLVYGYDAVVVIPKARAATLYGDRSD